jgi:hypothetical protein
VKIPRHYIYDLMDIAGSLRILQDVAEEIAANTRQERNAMVIPLRASRPPRPQTEPLETVAHHLGDAISGLVDITGEDMAARADAILAESDD